MKPFRIKVLINLLTHLLYYTPRKHQKPWDSRILEDFKIKVNNWDKGKYWYHICWIRVIHDEHYKTILNLKSFGQKHFNISMVCRKFFFKKFIVGHPHGKMIYQKATWKLIIWLTPTEKIVDAFFKKTFEKKKENHGMRIQCNQRLWCNNFDSKHFC